MISTKINVFDIVKAQFKSYRSYSTDKTSVKDLITFFILPGVISFILYWKSIHFDDQIGNLLTVVSILGGFLFNLMAIAQNITASVKKQLEEIKLINSELDTLNEKVWDPHQEKKNKVLTRFLDEINANISYNVLLSLALIVFMIVFSEIFIYWTLFPELCHAMEMLITFLLVHFGLNMLMILKRCFILLQPPKY